MHIYKTTNLVNGKFYIGQEKRFNPSYLGSGFILLKAIKKYGIENFRKEIIEDNINDKITLDEREIYWIKKLEARNHRIGYNVAKGGQGGDFLSQEMIDKRGLIISERKRGVSLSPQHIESIKKSTEKLKTPKKNGKRAGEKNGFYGKHHTGDLSRFSTHKGIPPTNAKSVIDEEGNIYRSCNEAAKIFPNQDVARRAISEVCKGQRAHFRGKKFKYI